MNPSFENPFRPADQRATKRLFGTSRNELNLQRIKEKTEKKKIKYGPHEIWDFQLPFLIQLEKSFYQEILDEEKKTARQILTEKIEVENGFIIGLDLENTGGPYLPKEISRLVKLKILNCSNTNFTTLPNLPRSLKSLTCSESKLTSLPKLPPFLEELTCDYTSLTSLPDLPDSLKELNCFGCSLTKLPALPNSLIELYCFDNQLTKLPKLPPTLKKLHCSGNQISSLPKLPDKLEILLCSKNKITRLPKLPGTLEEIEVAGNTLSERDKEKILATNADNDL